MTGNLWSAPNGVDSGDLPVPATLVYHVNADGTSTITLTADQVLTTDVYLITINGLTDIAGNVLTNAQGVAGPVYSSFTLQATPVNATSIPPLEVTGVTSFNGTVTINNNIVAQPDTIGVKFSQRLDIWTVNSSTVQLWAKTPGGSYVQVQAAVAYNPEFETAYLTPEAILSPGTVYVVTVLPTITNDVLFPSPGGALGTTFYDTFEVGGTGVGSGSSPLTVTATSPANGAPSVTGPEYVAVTFSEGINLNSLGRYSAMLKSQTGGVTTGTSGYADVPLNAKLAFNPNTNQLIIVPTGAVDANTTFLVALSNITATNGDPLTNPGGTTPVYSTFRTNSGGLILQAAPALVNTTPTATPVTIPTGTDTDKKDNSA